MFEQMKFDRSTVPDKIVDEIKSLIKERKLLPGEKLPPERDLSLKLNVSRNTIRESYKVLSTLGLIEIKHGQGAFVVEGTNHLARLTDPFFLKTDQFKDLFEIRRLIESQAVVWSVERASNTDMEDLYQYVQETVKLMNENRLTEGHLSDRDHRLHIRIAELSNNAIAYRIMNNLTDHFHDVREEATKIPHRLYDSWMEHLKIVEMMRRRHSLQAKAYMENHLDSVEKTLAKELKRGGGRI